MNPCGRRAFLGQISALSALGLLSGCQTWMGASRAQRRLFFTSNGRTAVINADGSGLRYFDFDVPDQVTWQPGPFFPDGRRVIFLSMEKRRDGPGRPFDQYYHKTPTHIWIHDLSSGSLQEICTKNRSAVFYTPALLVSEERLLVQVVHDSGGQIVNVNLDGTDAREFTRVGEGLPYGLSLSPDRQRVAYHLASPQGYQIWTSNVDGTERVKVAAHADRLYFGPSWSPDGRWLVFQSCDYRKDPGHDWSDVCVARPDGRELRVLTRGQEMWFGATYGNPQHRGGGSNLATWTREGHILFPRRLPGSKVAWEYQPQRPDVDHFNRDYKPELARGGVEICQLNPETGEARALTNSAPPVWDFRATQSMDGQFIAFCRASTGGLPSLWIMTSDGKAPRLIAQGIDNKGVDHPRWLPLRQGV